MYLDHSNITQGDIKSVVATMAQGLVSTAAPTTRLFEQAMAKWLGVPTTLATNSGTAALHLALLAAGIGPGDEVIVPTLTFAATANVVCYVGAKPVFADADPETWCMDATGRGPAAAVMPVHLYGNLCQLWTDAAPIVIEDAAESLGAKHYGHNCGNAGDYGCFSFNGNKTMTTGGGGLLVANHASRMARARHLATQAKIMDGTHSDIGYNYRMPALNAALGLAQLARLDEFLAKKREFNRIYREELSGLVRFQQATPNSEPSWWMSAAILPENMSVLQVQERLKRRGIPTRRTFRPVHHSPAYWEFAQGQAFPNADYIWKHGLCFPSSTLNTVAQVRYACKIIREVL